MTRVRVRIVNEGRMPGREYQADLEIDGEIVGRIERGLSQGGRRANDYRAKIGTTTIAEASNLRDLLRDVREVPADEIAEARTETFKLIGNSFGDR